MTDHLKYQRPLYKTLANTHISLVQLNKLFLNS